MTLGKSTVYKFEAIDDYDERVEAVVNLSKPSMSEMLVIHRNSVRVHTAKDAFRLDFIVALNTSGVLNNSAVV